MHHSAHSFEFVCGIVDFNAESFVCFRLLFNYFFIADHFKSIFKTIITKSIVQCSIFCWFCALRQNRQLDQTRYIHRWDAKGSLVDSGIFKKCFNLWLQPNILPFTSQQSGHTCVWFCDAKTKNIIGLSFRLKKRKKLDDQHRSLHWLCVQTEGGHKMNRFDRLVLYYCSSCRVYFARSYCAKSPNNRHFEIKIRSHEWVKIDQFFWWSFVRERKSETIEIYQQPKIAGSQIEFLSFSPLCFFAFSKTIASKSRYIDRQLQNHTRKWYFCSLSNSNRNDITDCAQRNSFQTKNLNRVTQME